MTITKEKKNQLLAKYKEDLSSATNAVIVKQSGIPVTLANKIRMELKTADGNMNIIKKRIFLKALKDAGLEGINVETLEGSVFALYAKENEFGPLKVINKYLKEFKKANKGSEFTFLGGWFEKKWQAGEYVNELANVPTKEELISKLCYLFNYPLQSFAAVLNEIAKKQEAWSLPAEIGPKFEPVKAEVKEEVKIEEVKSEVIASESEAIQEKTEDTPAPVETVTDIEVVDSK